MPLSVVPDAEYNDTINVEGRIAPARVRMRWMVASAMVREAGCDHI